MGQALCQEPSFHNMSLEVTGERDACLGSSRFAGERPCGVRNLCLSNGESTALHRSCLMERSNKLPMGLRIVYQIGATHCPSRYKRRARRQFGTQPLRLKAKISRPRRSLALLFPCERLHGQGSTNLSLPIGTKCLSRRPPLGLAGWAKRWHPSPHA